ncbi:hypothetical protein V6N13_062645 [Hibiscus sabdariffa]
MECKKFASLLVPMAICLLLAIMSPTVTAARNEARPFSIIANANIRNPLAGTFFVDKPAGDCLNVGRLCYDHAQCCSRMCLIYSTRPPFAKICV